eukprot:6570498-Lingulodinium_polyedra.AAC.1
MIVSDARQSDALPLCSCPVAAEEDNAQERREELQGGDGPKGLATSKCPRGIAAVEHHAEPPGTRRR